MTRPQRWIGILGLLGLLGGQIAFGWWARPLRPGLEEMPFPPQKSALLALGFGDEEFLFRGVARWLQGVGDGDGRVRPLIAYDYDRVLGWLTLLDSLDDRSDIGMTLATDYFGAVMEPKRGPPLVEKVIIYVRGRALADPARRWPALVWATSKVLHVVKNPGLADQIGQDLVRLRGTPGTPDWLSLLAPALFRLAGDASAERALESDPSWVALRAKSLADLRRARGH